MPWTDAKKQQLRRDYAKGVPVEKIAKKWGMTPGRIMTMAWRLRLPPHPNRWHGMAQTQAEAVIELLLSRTNEFVPLLDIWNVMHPDGGRDFTDSKAMSTVIFKIRRKRGVILQAQYLPREGCVGRPRIAAYRLVQQDELRRAA